MAEDKKSIILHIDLIYTFEKLTNDEAGILVKHLFRYVNDKNPTPPDRTTDLVFEPIKQQLKRDLVKWEKTKIKNSESGSKGGKKSAEKRKKKKQKEASQATDIKNEGSLENSKRSQANQAVSVSVSDSVIGSVSETVIVTEKKEIINIPDSEKESGPSKNSFNSKKKKDPIPKKQVDYGIPGELWPKVVGAYIEFYKLRTVSEINPEGLKPQFDNIQGKKLQEVFRHLKTFKTDQTWEDALDNLKAIFSNWEKVDKFYQDQIDLKNIHSNLNNIINGLTKKQQSTSISLERNAELANKYL